MHFAIDARWANAYPYLCSARNDGEGTRAELAALQVRAWRYAFPYAHDMHIECVCGALGAMHSRMRTMCILVCARYAFSYAHHMCSRIHTMIILVCARRATNACPNSPHNACPNSPPPTAAALARRVSARARGRGGGLSGGHHAGCSAVRRGRRVRWRADARRRRRGRRRTCDGCVRKAPFIPLYAQCDLCISEFAPHFGMPCHTGTHASYAYPNSRSQTACMSSCAARSRGVRS